MVKAIIVGEVPTAEVTCGNCHSVLRYGNADLIKTYPKENLFLLKNGFSLEKWILVKAEHR